MIRRILIVLLISSLTTPGFSQKPRVDITGNHLLKTKWGGAKPFNMYAPAESTLGCHSIAAAQILFFHQLSPHGRVSYKCSNGTMISEDFSNYIPQWKEFALEKDPENRDNSSIRETSRFLYYVAAVVRKDFGTNQYVGDPNDCHKKEAENHFQCTLTAYSKKVKTSMSQTLKEEINFYKLIKTEIDSKRPVGFYYTDRKGGGHAVVIDGYIEKNTKLYFHVNFGWCGDSDGWYLLEDDLPKNTKEVVVITIVPNDSSSSGKTNDD